MLTPGSLQSNEAVVVPRTGLPTPGWFRPLAALFGAMYNPWNDVLYVATRFTGSGAMTWVVDDADAAVSYLLRGTTLTLFFVIAGTVVGGVPDTALRIAIPRALIANRTVYGVYRADDNGAVAAAQCRVVSGNTYVEFFRNIAGTGNWAAGAAGLAGQFTFEVAEP